MPYGDGRHEAAVVGWNQRFPGVSRVSGPSAPSFDNTVVLRKASVCAMVALLALVGGCRSLPNPSELSATAIHLSPHLSARGVVDGRSRFRAIFCDILRRDGVVPPEDKDCDRLLWRLPDEPVESDHAPLPALDRSLRFLIVTGALADCFGSNALPYRDGAARLTAHGLRVDTLRVSGRSSADHNAGQIAAHLEKDAIGAGERLVLLGYSKGAIDILHFLGAYPHLAERVAAVVSVAGPVFGSPLAEQGAWTYDHLLANALPDRCDPGDGGLVDSMLPSVRSHWLDEHSLAEHIEYFSIGAFTTSEKIAWGLRSSWRLLAAADRRNDGQVLAGDSVIPGSTLLGYANADHWGLAITIERELPHLAGRPVDDPFPQAALLEAMMRYGSERLGENEPSP